MGALKFSYRGSEINKLPFSDIEYYLEEKGFNVSELFDMMADEREYVYVSNGFLRGLMAEENEPGEWHHFFKKDSDGDFVAEKLEFKRN